METFFTLIVMLLCILAWIHLGGLASIATLLVGIYIQINQKKKNGI